MSQGLGLFTDKTPIWMYSLCSSIFLACVLSFFFLFYLFYGHVKWWITTTRLMTDLFVKLCNIFIYINMFFSISSMRWCCSNIVFVAAGALVCCCLNDYYISLWYLLFVISLLFPEDSLADSIPLTGKFSFFNKLMTCVPLPKHPLTLVFLRY